MKLFTSIDMLESRCRIEANPDCLHEAVVESRQGFLQTGADHILDILADLSSCITHPERENRHG